MSSEIKPKTPSRISAANLIFIAAFFYTLIPTIVILTSANNEAKVDMLGIGLMSLLYLFAIAYWVTGILLYNKSRIGLYIWWPSSIFLLINIPLGTLIAVMAYVNLHKSDAKEELK